MALVILAENIEVAGNYELRVDAQYLLTSMASPTRAKRGNNGDMWTRFFRARKQKPQCILRVARVWRGHITARELAIGCATIFDMRGTFADEMAGRAAARVEVLPGQAGAIQAVDGMAWQVRMGIIEANLAAFTDQPKREFMPPRVLVHRKIRQERTSELLSALRKWDTSSKGSGADATTTTVKSVVKAAASASGNSLLRAALQFWPDTMPTDWQRARAVYQREWPKDVRMTTRTPSDTAERWANVRRKARQVHMKRALLITT